MTKLDYFYCPYCGLEEVDGGQYACVAIRANGSVFACPECEEVSLQEKQEGDES